LFNYGNYTNNTLYDIGKDLSRPTKFNAILAFPEGTGGTDLAKTINVLLKSFEVPEVQHETLEIKYRGHSIPVKGKTNFSHSFSCTFYLDDDNALYNAFYSWLMSLDTDRMGSKTISHGDFTKKYGQLIIESLLFDELESSMRYLFFNIFPTNITGLQFDPTAASSVQEFTVTFSFSYFEALPVNNLGLNDLLGKLKDKAYEIIEDTLEDIFSPGKDILNEVGK
jgi:hypothetical protein